jgi:neutral ceramidase
MRLCFIAALVSILSVSPAAVAESLWKAGVAAVRITPDQPIWLTGFGARTNESRGTLHDLHAKALALEDASGNRAVLVTSDLLGFPAEVAARIAAEAEKQHGLQRSQLLLNSSHTHGAPALSSPAHFIYGPRTTPEQWRRIEAYTRELEIKIARLIGAALANLQPARLGFAQGKTDFGINRRKKTATGIQSFVPNPDGPVDHAVPVLRIDSLQGRLLGVVFGYAAHPTTITGGEHYYDFSPDYPGFAQAYIEAEHSGAVALFVQGCGGDIMVSPRGTAGLARQYGEKLGAETTRVLKGDMRSVRGPINTAFDTVRLEFAAPPSRAVLEEKIKTGDLYHRWHAREMLDKLQDERLPRTYPYPLQAWQFGDSLTVIGMAGEVVVDYALRLKKELGGDTLWVAGYSNDLCAYIPSRRVLEEGGYEGGDAMVYYMQPGPFAPSVEEVIMTKARELVTRVRAK